MDFKLPPPGQQIGYTRALLAARKLYLQQALGNALAEHDIAAVDEEFRGGSNNTRGTDAIEQVFDIVHAIVKPAVVVADSRSIALRNAARRKVVIEFAADPDLVIREHLSRGSMRNVVAIEIKGGKDYSNIHNRIGEAEKSHRKARDDGYTECWTVVNVSGLDMDMARKESPTTDRFYGLSALLDKRSEEYRDFRSRIAALTGIRLTVKKESQGRK